MIINSNESIPKQVIGGFIKKATSVAFVSSAGLSTPAMKMALFFGYFFAVVHFAKYTDPEFMRKSIGVVDSILRAYLVSAYKVVKGDINPLYLSFALYPFGIYAYWMKIMMQYLRSKQGKAHMEWANNVKLSTYELK